MRNWKTIQSTLNTVWNDIGILKWGIERIIPVYYHSQYTPQYPKMRTWKSRGAVRGEEEEGYPKMRNWKTLDRRRCRPHPGYPKMRNWKGIWPLHLGNPCIACILKWGIESRYIRNLGGNHAMRILKWGIESIVLFQIDFRLSSSILKWGIESDEHLCVNRPLIVS